MSNMVNFTLLVALDQRPISRTCAGGLELHSGAVCIIIVALPSESAYLYLCGSALSV